MLAREKQNMARRKEIKGIIDGLISSFISRNNDLNGYWAMGKLCGFLIQSNSRVLTLELMKNGINQG